MARAAEPGRWSTFAVLLATALALLSAVFLPLWKPLFMALVLAGALSGLEDRLAGAKGRRRLAAGLLSVGVVVVVVIPLAVVVTFAVREVVSAVQAVSAILQSEGPRGLVDLVPDALQQQAQQWIAANPGWAGELARKLPAQGLAAAGVVGNALSASGRLVFETVLMVVALFFLLADGPRLSRWVCEVSPLGERPTATLLGELRETSSRVLLSVGLTAGVQALISLLGYWIAGVPHPLFFAALTFFAALVPSVGTSLVGLPLAAYLLLTGHWGRAIFLAAWMLLLTGTVDNVLKPYLARGGAVELDGALVFFAMIGGIVVFGPLGLVVGPVSLAFFRSVIHIGEELRRSRAAAGP